MRFGLLSHTFLTLLAVAACVDDSGTSGAAGAGGAIAPMGGAAGGVMTPMGGAAAGGAMALPDAIIPDSGAYHVGVSLTELGGFVFPLKVEIDAEVIESGGIIRRFSVRAVKDGEVSDPIAVLTDLPVSAEGTFEAALPETSMPAAFSPTGSDVVFEISFHATIQSRDFICGHIDGMLTTLDTPLTESTFGAEPWETRGDQPPVRCGGGAAETNCPRVEAAACPELAAGLVTGFESCGLERTFILHLPADHDPATPRPVVFLWHGLGDEATAILEGTAMADFVDQEDFILITPSSQALPVEWDQLAVADNADLAFFDDMVTCAQAKLGADPNRVHVTGMSAGGLWSTYLAVFRSQVIASAAPMSGGLIADYAVPPRKMPVLVSWGGETDQAVDQDFHVFAQNLMSDLEMGGHFYVSCNHRAEHAWHPQFTPWVLRFLFDHPFDVAPEPYAEMLPDVFPDYCVIPD